MRRSINSLIIFLLMTGGVLPTNGQQTTDKNQQAEKPKPQVKRAIPSSKKAADENPPEDTMDPIPRQALALLDQLFDETKDLKDGVTRTRMQARIADALWIYDEARARLMFEKAFHGIEDLKTKPVIRFGMIDKLNDPKFLLRQEIAKMVAKRDAAFAKALLKSVLEPPADTSSSKSSAKAPPPTTQGNRSDRSTLLIRLANTAIDVDTTEAARYLTESLNYDLAPEFLRTLIKLRTKDQMAADRVFLQTLNYAENHMDTKMYMLDQLAPYSLPDYLQRIQFNPYTGDIDFNELLAQRPPSLTNVFLDFVYKWAVQQNAEEQKEENQSTEPLTSEQQAEWGVRYMRLKILMTYFDQYDPDKAVDLRVLLNSTEKKMSDMMRRMSDMRFGGDTIEANVAEAEKHNDPVQERLHDVLYDRASRIAFSQGDIDQALNLIAKMKNRDLRDISKTLMLIDHILVSLKNNDPDVAFDTSKKLDVPVLQALGFYQIGCYWQKKNDPARAKDSFEEASKRLDSADKSLQRGQASLLVTTAMARTDLMRGFELMEVSIGLINKDEPPPADKDKDEVKPKPDPVFPDDMAERIQYMKERAYTGLGLLGLNFDEAFLKFGDSDFVRSLLLTRSLDKKENLILAQLAACKGALSKVEVKSKPDDKAKSKSTSPDHN